MYKLPCKFIWGPLGGGEGVPKELWSHLTEKQRMIAVSYTHLELLKRGHEGVGSDIQETYSGVADGSAVTKAPYVALDITDKDAVEKVITEVNPDAVIHCAAWTAVDMAEDDDKVAKVRAINAGGTQNIADVCKKLDCKMTYISTDYVFDGQGTEPWKPDCKDYKPLNVYGQTKLCLLYTSRCV